MRHTWPALLFLTALAWAGCGLGYPAWHALRTRPRALARAGGHAWRGVVYMFTTAMLPSHKESVSRHPASFLLGLTLHVAAFGSLIAVAVGLAAPAWFHQLRHGLLGLAVLGLVAAGALVVRRVLDPVTRAITVPDDYLASGLAIVFLATVAITSLAVVPFWAASVAGSVLLFYVPLGKLRHMVVFFLARADLGARLGFRGALPGTVGSRRQRA